MYSSALSIEIISDVEFSRRLVESRSDKLKQVKSRKTTQLSRRKTTQLSRRKTTQLVSRNETTRLSRKNNSTRQQERNNSTLYCRRPPAPPLQQNRLFLPTNPIFSRNQMTQKLAEGTKKTRMIREIRFDHLYLDIPIS
ncbi:hypothetical protein TNCV_2633891 [Trichonephila clavipes]|nr:hypothetical protein TNCV_2633891 [Trichonephila clavipes]